ncbi:MAG: F0F1 ATP synthase subunit A [Chloroflexota bacterium]
MELSPDSSVFWRWGAIVLNATIVYTWLVMALLVVASWLVTRKLSTETSLSRSQNMLETIVTLMRRQIGELIGNRPDALLPFIGTLFLFISVSNFLAIVPGYEPPTGSLSTTAALALCVFVAVPTYGIRQQGLIGYLKYYTEPVVFMLPFKVISEISRTVALAVRLFGNIMSGGLIIAIMLSVVPFFVPIALHALELLIGQIQAYIFAVLATVYIASAARIRSEEEQTGVGERDQEAESKEQ